MRQKDVETRWFRKNGVTHFGFKNHVVVDRETKLITNWDVSPTNVRDSQVFEILLDDDPPRGHEVYAVRADRSRERVGALRARGYKPWINDKGKRSQPLSSREVALNHGYSKVRCRVEHVFGSLRNETRVRYMTVWGCDEVGCGLAWAMYATTP